MPPAATALGRESRSVTTTAAAAARRDHAAVITPTHRCSLPQTRGAYLAFMTIAALYGLR